jgi:hypothetical protein
MSVTGLINNIEQYILNPLIALLFAIAFLIFFIGIFQMIVDSQSGKDTGESKKKVLYGLIGMFVMFSAYGLVHLILTTFGIATPSTIAQ